MVVSRPRLATLLALVGVLSIVDLATVAGMVVLRLFGLRRSRVFSSREPTLIADVRHVLEVERLVACVTFSGRSRFNSLLRM